MPSCLEARQLSDIDYKVGEDLARLVHAHEEEHAGCERGERVHVAPRVARQVREAPEKGEEGAGDGMATRRRGGFDRKIFGHESPFLCEHHRHRLRARLIRASKSEVNNALDE